MPFYSEKMRFRIEEVHFGKAMERRPSGPILAILSFLSMVYGGIVSTRQALYRQGLFRQRTLPATVISVGNLIVGGTGKTPVTIHLARILREEGRRVAILSRGYGRKGKDQEVVSDLHTIRIQWTCAGDEPFMMAKALPGVPVIVGKDRFASGMEAIRSFGVDTILLDDGFQNLRLRRDLDILLVDGRRGVGNGRLLPRGPLRERVQAIHRADLVMITKADRGGKRIALPCMPEVPVFESRYRISGLRLQGDGKELPSAFLRGKRVVAFCGIADPDGFFSMVEGAGARIDRRVPFPDHHPYTSGDLERMRPWAEEADLYVTTEKDAVRLVQLGEMERPLCVLRIEVEILEEERFRQFLAKRLK